MLTKLKTLISKILPRSGFARNVALLVGGTAGAQLLVVLSAPIITRLYNPTHFGLLATYTAILSLFTVVDTLRYELAIPLPEDDKPAAALIALCVSLNLAATVISAIIIYFYKSQIAELFKLPEIADYLWLLPIGIILSGTYKTFSYWAIRKKNFKIVASTRIKQSLAVALIQIIAYKLQALGLLISQACSQAVGTMQLGKSFFVDQGFKSLTRSDIKNAAIRYKHFPLYSTWGGLFNTAGTQLPPLLFTILFSPTIAGLYSLANRVLSMPMSLVGTAIGQSFFAEAPQAHREGRLGNLVLKLHSILASFGMAPCLMLIIAGPQLFSLVFGENWVQAGEFARYMAPWLYLVFVASPLTTITTVVEKQKQGMFFQFILVSSRVAAICLASLTQNIEYTVIAFAAISVLNYFGLLIWIGHLAKITAIKMLTPTMKVFIPNLFFMFPLVYFLYFYSNKINWIYGLLLSGLFILMNYLKIYKTIRN